MWLSRGVCALSLAMLFHGGASVRLLEIQVPSMVQAGATVHLVCRYDLEGASLYSLNWWRGSQQFYQFSPNTPRPITVYDSPGINVDTELSGRDVVVLRNVTHTTAGRFKCEVLADYPSFEKDSEFTHMEVIDVPSRPPVLVLDRLQWSPGETLEANCTSPGARPPPQLHWYINGDKIHPKYYRKVTHESLNYLVGGIGNMMDRAVSDVTHTSLLKMKLTGNHFSHSGQATLICSASLPELYHRSAEVSLSLPGFRAAAPSQKLYGSARRPGGGLLSLVCSIAVSVLLVL
ncbi:uncharacterized protein [Penaeus vannamei]|uniref:uncharacterized protein n=1 Tax=Penaeus vannamei TaxID=6689 RepID=UPI00387F7705